jgi:hypothetical protein
MTIAAAPGPSATSNDLIALLQATEGLHLAISNPPDPVRRRWRQALWLASCEHAAPEGYRIRFSGREREDLVIRLVSLEEDAKAVASTSELPPVPEPSTLRRAHPLIIRSRSVISRSGDGWGVSPMEHLADRSCLGCFSRRPSARPDRRSPGAALAFRRASGISPAQRNRSTPPRISLRPGRVHRGPGRLQGQRSHLVR